MHPLVKISRALSAALAPMTFGPPVTHVYDPLRYARAPHEAYLTKYGDGPKEVLFVGMNPGPFGMAQTGVPFGEVGHVRNWLRLDAPVGKPESEHPKRPILGFDCPRSEVSGRRFWGWAAQRWGTPEAFFARFFVGNYCPLVFMEGERGRNRVPEKLPKPEREPLLAACDDALRQVVEVLRPRWVVGVGKWAAVRAERALSDLPVEVGQVLHPSPANPRANRGWAPQVEAQLAELGIAL